VAGLNADRGSERWEDGNMGSKKVQDMENEVLSEERNLNGLLFHSQGRTLV
jgi:hypothetical protein